MQAWSYLGLDKGSGNLRKQAAQELLNPENSNEHKGSSLTCQILMVMQSDKESLENWLDQARRIIVYCRKTAVSSGKMHNKDISGNF